MYEGTNVVEIHTTTISDASSFDGGATTTQGVENLDGSGGVAVPGRNGTIFSASNDAYRFTQYIPYTYSWMPGNLNAASQTVVPASTGAYTVNVSDGTACIASSSTSSIVVNTNCIVLNLKIFLEGYFTNNGKMKSVLYNNSFNSDSTVCDTITVELHNSTSPFSKVSTIKTLIHTNGKASIVYPDTILNQSYYIVIRHRQSIETWSKNPILFNTQVKSFDFTSQ